MTDQERLKSAIENGEYVVFFGGAGVSTASGIPDFRGANGIFTAGRRFSAEQIVSSGFFYAHPKEFYDFYKSKMLYPNALPNRAHHKLAELESRGKVKAIITQNIDGLHQKAGSKNVIELHGSALRNYCQRCGKSFDLNYIVKSDGVPRCDKCGEIIKPDVVLYGEQLDETVLERAWEEVEKCDVLIVGGTSLSVYPAASFVYAFRGKTLVVINKTPTGADERASFVIRDNIAEAFDF